MPAYTNKVEPGWLEPCCAIGAPAEAGPAGTGVGLDDLSVRLIWAEVDRGRTMLHLIASPDSTGRSVDMIAPVLTVTYHDRTPQLSGFVAGYCTNTGPGGAVSKCWSRAAT